jgi:hypothetical protein
MNKYILLTIILTFLCVNQAYSQEEYSSSIVFTVPWGNNCWELSSDFETSEDLEVLEPGPFAISDNGDLIIVDHKLNPEKQYITESIIKKFDSSGNLITYRPLSEISLDLTRPWNIAISNNGASIISSSCVPQRIFILDSDLSLCDEIIIPDSDCLFSFTASENNSFWLAFKIIGKINGVEYHQYYKTEIFLDGTYSTPEITWDDVTNTGVPARYISPTGEPFLSYADVYGYLYNVTDRYEGLRLNKSKLNQEGTEYDIIYTNTIISDPGWVTFDYLDSGEKHFITWSGDFYTIRATDAGMVLTKYTYIPY